MAIKPDRTSPTPDVSPPHEIKVPDEVAESGAIVLSERGLGYVETGDVLSLFEATGPALIAAYLRGKADETPSAELGSQLRDWADELDPTPESAAELRATARELHFAATHETCRGCASHMHEKAVSLMRRADEMDGAPR